MDRGAWWATVHRIARVGHDLATKPPPLLHWQADSWPLSCLGSPCGIDNIGLIFTWKESASQWVDYHTKGHKATKKAWTWHSMMQKTWIPEFTTSVQSLNCVWLFASPWTAARQASLSITNSQSSPKLLSIESVMPSNHLILCCPLLLLPSIFPSIKVFSNESALRIRWPKYWSFSFNISPSNEYPGLISFHHLEETYLE